MNESIPQPPLDDEESRLKIYFLPNLLTAGNLFCGFVALTKIVDANLVPDAAGYVNWMPIKLALAFILLACIFDLFDGRVARMGGVESPFGREFDSLADLISFGVAPAFLVQRVVLADVFGGYHRISWFIASIYLLCGAFRLARFNCLSAMPHSSGSKDFLGFPIPSAAGLVASLTLLIIHFNEKERPRPLELSHRGGALISVGHDGEHGAISEFQIARPALDEHVHEDDWGGAVRRLHCGSPGKNSLLRAARVFHGVSGLWLRATAPLARVAARN